MPPDPAVEEEKTHGEQKSGHPGVAGGAGLGCGNIRKRTVIQGSVSNEHHHSPVDAQQQ
jgi:hypothetical protein